MEGDRHFRGRSSIRIETGSIGQCKMDFGDGTESGTDQVKDPEVDLGGSGLDLGGQYRGCRSH
jgi:hypothetical protein